MIYILKKDQREYCLAHPGFVSKSALGMWETKMSLCFIFKQLHSHFAPLRLKYEWSTSASPLGQSNGESESWVR